MGAAIFSGIRVSGDKRIRNIEKVPGQQVAPAAAKGGKYIR